LPIDLKLLRGKHKTLPHNQQLDGSELLLVETISLYLRRSGWDGTFRDLDFCISTITRRC
jgi:hypothetical protein